MLPRRPLLLSTSLLLTLISLSTSLQDQQASGWVDMFDGKTLNGWTQRSGTATYRMEDGVVIGQSTKGSPNAFLCTDRFYGDFEMRFETKLLFDKLNSGIQVRSNSHPGYRKGRVHGYQVELTSAGDAGFIYDENRSGWLSKDRKDPAKRAAFRSGQWNKFRIRCEGDSIQTWINGIQIADVRDDQSAHGFIGLQAKDGPGRLVTRPFRLEGEKLELNVDASAGWVQVEVLDRTGKPLPGLSGTDSSRSKAVNAVRFRPEWNGETRLSALRGRVVRLRFLLHEATLFAFQVR